MDKMTPQQALQNLVAVAQQFKGYGMEEAQIVMQSIQILAQHFQTPVEAAAEVVKAAEEAKPELKGV